MNETEFFAALISYMKPKYESLANLLDTRPEKWLDSIQKIRELCEERGIKGEEQIPYVVANHFLMKTPKQASKSLLEILAFMKRMADFEKRSAEKNFLVGRKK